MSMQDLLSDYVARINNAVAAGHKTVSVIKNNIVLQCTKKLVRLGYFSSFTETDRELLVTLNASKLPHIKRISKPGKRVFTSYERMPRIEGGVGWNILTTSKGVKTNYEAKQENIGGELLFQVF